MAKINFKSVDEYLESQPDAVQPMLKEVRDAIRNALPAAEEGISYNIPTYKRNGAAILYFAGWKQHYSLYPASALLLEEFESELTLYQVEKSTIRFPLNQPVPVKLIQRIARFRAKESERREQAKVTGSTKK